MNNQHEVISGVSGGLFSNLLLKAAHVYKNPLEALLEYFQNALDEDMTRQVWVLLDQENRRITIGDDGTGMGGPMPDEDTKLVDLYYQIIGNGESPGCDLRDIISEPATHTLEWLIRNIANSIKSNRSIDSEKPNPELARFMKASGRQPRRRAKRSTMGKFGIGAWAFLSFATDMTISSQPNPELAKSLGFKPGQAFEIKAPGKAKLEAHKLGYELYSLPQGLTNLYDEPIPHGTIVTIDGVTDVGWEEITVDTLVAYLRDMFGSKIETSGMEILVAERSTGRIERVPPQVIRGRVIIDSIIYSYDGTPCSILITYDSKARNLIPKVTKFGATICLLSDLKSKGQSVFSGFWESGRVGGRIAFEHVERGDDDLFDASKHGILESDVRKHWVKQIKALELEISRAIKEIEDEAQNERLNQAVEMINKTLEKALKNLQITFPIGQPPKPSSEKPPNEQEKAPRKALESVIVQVVDRNNRGVQGVEVSLRNPPYDYGVKTTGVSGSVQFGHPQKGEHRVRITTEHPVRDRDTFRFMIDPEQGITGQRIKFVLDIEQEGEKINTPQIEVAFNVWDDPHEPWRQSIKSMGVIEFNIGAETTLRQLLDREHFVIADGLMAEFTSSAIMEALKEGGDHGSRVRQSNLFAEIHTGLQEARSEGTRAPRKKKS
jgi:hypothetical protein